MTPVEGARTNLPSGQPAPVSRAQASSVGSWPLARLEREQLEALAELIASRIQQARDDRAPDKRKQLVTARQAAELLAVDLKTVYRHAKELGGRKVGGAWRFDLDAAAMDDPTESSARYASERPQPSKPHAAPGSMRSRGRATDRIRCQLLPVGSVADRESQTPS